MIIDCKQIKQQKIEKLKGKVNSLSFTPKLAIISAVGYDNASSVYIKNKIKTCNEIGIDVEVIDLKYKEVDNKFSMLYRIINAIELLNSDNCINGIIVQLPLPYGITEKDFADFIDWRKDVDGFNSINRGRLINGMDCLIPCTASAVMSVLPKDLSYKYITLINRSGLIGLPLFKLLTDRNGTVTMCHSKTCNTQLDIACADIVISAVGEANFINIEDIQHSKIIIDVAITRDEVGKLCGDIPKDKYDYLDKIGVKYTTVPNGIGILTCVELANNVVKSCELQELK